MEENTPIKIIRLITGEDLIASVIESEIIIKDETYITYILVEPLKLIYTIKAENGMLSIGLVQWFFSKITQHNSYEIHPKDVLTMADASKDMVEYYEATLAQFEAKTKEMEKSMGMGDNDFINPDEAPQLLNEMLNKLKAKKDIN